MLGRRIQMNKDYIYRYITIDISEYACFLVYSERVFDEFK